MNVRSFIENKVLPHRKGVMGTVVFHLALAVLFLGMKVSGMQVHREMEIVFETSDVKEVEKNREEIRKKEEIRHRSSDEEVERMLKSIAVNEAVPRSGAAARNVQQYVDEIMEELGEDGDRYRARRDKDYSRDSLQHVLDTKQESLDSMKSVFYSGKSSVSYLLEGRFARFLPIPVYRCESGGTVVVVVGVNRKGVVQKAEVSAGASVQDENLWRVAVEAAQRSRFNAKASAPALQQGRITYHFVKQ